MLIIYAVYGDQMKIMDIIILQWIKYMLGAQLRVFKLLFYTLGNVLSQFIVKTEHKWKWWNLILLAQPRCTRYNIMWYLHYFRFSLKCYNMIGYEVVTWL
jgi:hypothetical protein